MPSSGYQAETFTAGEVPTTTIWNFLWSNDASFNTGNGFNDGIIIARHFATNAVPAVALATNAILLGSAAITSNFLPGTTALTDITSATVTVTIPAGGRDILILAKADIYNTGGADEMSLSVRESSTTLESGTVACYAANKPATCYFGAHVAAAVATAGSHTYKLSVAGNVANPAVQASSTETCYIAVLAI